MVDGVTKSRIVCLIADFVKLSLSYLTFRMQCSSFVAPNGRNGGLGLTDKTLYMKKSSGNAVIICLLAIGLFATDSAQSQCYKPRPLSPNQTSIIKGVWKGTYQLDGETIPVTITIYTDGTDEVACDVDAPPVEGKEDTHLYWFCDGGEFHLKKFIGNKTYSFQGTPVNDVIKGIVVIRENEKTIANGKFQIKKIQSGLASRNTGGKDVLSH